MKRVPFNQNYLLGAGAVLMLFVSYQLAFKPTIAAWQTHGQLKQQMANVTDVSTSPAYMARKSKNLEQIISNYQLDSATFRTNVINTIAGIAEHENVKLTGVPADEDFYHTPRFIVQKITVEARFFDLLKLLDQAEKAKAIGLLRSATFKAGRSNSTADNIPPLSLELYLEIYRK